MPTVPEAYFPEFERFIALPTVLGEAIRGMELAAFNRRPPGDDWAIRDHVMHLVDYELVFAVKIRMVVAGEEGRLPSFAEDTWKRRLHYLWRDPDAALALLAQLRWTNAELLNNGDAATWERSGVKADGTPVTVAGLLSDAVAHADEHLARIREVRALGA